MSAKNSFILRHYLTGYCQDLCSLFKANLMIRLVENNLKNLIHIQ